MLEPNSPPIMQQQTHQQQSHSQPPPTDPNHTPTRNPPTLSPVHSFFHPKTSHTPTVLIQGKDNTPSTPLGGTLEDLTTKASNTIRISSFNRGGIQCNSYSDVLTKARNLHIDIQGFSEHNLNTNHYTVRKRLHETSKKFDRTSVSTWATSEIDSIADFKPGGTSMIAFDKITSCIKMKGSDPMGRWSYMLLEGKANHTVLIVTVYQCVTPTNKHGNAAYHQQQLMLSTVKTHA